MIQNRIWRYIKHSQLLLVVLVFCSSACERARHENRIAAQAITPPSLESVEKESEIFFRKRPPISLKKPSNSADTSFAVSYAQNALSFYQSLITQFETNISTAVTSGYLTQAQQTGVLQGVRKRDRLLSRSLNKYLRKLGVRSRIGAALRATTVTFPSPFDPPVKKIPTSKNQSRLTDIRTIFGQVESYSGLAISFTNSLTDQIVQSASASQKSLARQLESKLVRSFTKDINAIRKFIRFVNTRRFKSANDGKIDPSAFSGSYSGVCTNITAGATENVSMNVVYSEDDQTFTITFDRPDNLFGDAASEMFQVAYSESSGLKYSETLPLFGETIVKMTARGFITGTIGAEPTSEIDRVDVWGLANSSDSSIFLDVRTDFPSYSEGGQAHMTLAFTKDP